MSLFIQQLGETLALGLGKGVRCRRLLDAAATYQDHGQHTKAQHQQARRAVPEQQGLRIHRRVVTNEVAITVHQVIDDLVVALPLLQHAEDFLAQIHRDGRVGIGDVLILALRTTQLFGQRPVALAFGLIAKLVGVDRCLGRGNQEQPQQRSVDQSFHSSTNS